MLTVVEVPIYDSLWGFSDSGYGDGYQVGYFSPNYDNLSSQFESFGNPGGFDSIPGRLEFLELSYRVTGIPESYSRQGWQVSGFSPFGNQNYARVSYLEIGYKVPNNNGFAGDTSELFELTRGGQYSGFSKLGLFAVEDSSIFTRDTSDRPWIYGLIPRNGTRVELPLQLTSGEVPLDLALDSFGMGGNYSLPESGGSESLPLTLGVSASVSSGTASVGTSASWRNPALGPAETSGIWGGSFRAFSQQLGAPGEPLTSRLRPFSATQNLDLYQFSGGLFSGLKNVRLNPEEKYLPGTIGADNSGVKLLANHLHYFRPIRDLGLSRLPGIYPEIRIACFFLQ